MEKHKETLKVLSKRIRPLLIVLVGGAVLMIALQALFSFLTPVDTQSKWGYKKNKTVETPDAFKNISLEAQAAYVFDIKNQKVIFALRENDKLPLASLTKIMTALVARDYASESALVTLSRGDLAAEGDSGLHGGERWRLGDLMNAMLIISSNDAAHAVARFIGADGQPTSTADEDNARMRFVSMMNAKALELKLLQMEFLNESGLDIEDAVLKDTMQGILPTGHAGAYGSAHDVALLFTELWQKYPTTIEITALPAARIVSQDNIVHVLPNTDEAIGKFPGLIASKTGYTPLAGGNLAILFDRGFGNPVVAVVLGSSIKGRFEDMEKLVIAAQK